MHDMASGHISSAHALIELRAHYESHEPVQLGSRKRAGSSTAGRACRLRYSLQRAGHALLLSQEAVR